jgi:hypothetical protein
MKIYSPLWSLFRDDKESVLAEELFARYDTLAFKYWIAFMDDICSQLNILSKQLQDGNLNVVDLFPKIILSVKRLHLSFVVRSHSVMPLTPSLKNFYERLPEDGFSDELIGMYNNCICFAERIIGNISKRFPQDSQQIIDAMSFCYPEKLLLNGQELDEKAASEKAAMDILMHHYAALFDTDSLPFEFQCWEEFIKTHFRLSAKSEEFLYAVFNSLRTKMDVIV